MLLQAEFAVAEKDLDFGHMRDQLRRIMVGESSLFAMSSSNAVFQFVGGGVRVMESTVWMLCLPVFAHFARLALGGFHDTLPLRASCP